MTSSTPQEILSAWDAFKQDNPLNPDPEKLWLITDAMGDTLVKLVGVLHQCLPHLPPCTSVEEEVAEILGVHWDKSNCKFVVKT